MSLGGLKRSLTQFDTLPLAGCLHTSVSQSVSK